MIDCLVIETGVSPLRRCQELLSGKHYERLVVTGYGRHQVAPALHGEAISEISATLSVHDIGIQIATQ